MKFILSILIIVLFAECKTNFKIEPLSTPNKWINDSLIIKWKLDSNGCNGFRSHEMIDSIFKKFDLSSKSIDSIKLILGRPNSEWENESTHGLKYFFGAICINDTLRTGTDKCWIDILSSKNKAGAVSFSAACE